MDNQETKNCPYCGELINIAAKKCKHCGEWLEEKTETESRTINCPYCGEEILSTALKCKHCGEMLGGSVNLNTYNNHNRVQKQLPYELQKFNWGAFFLSWIWGLGNNSYHTCWIFVAYFALIIPIFGWLAPIGIFGLSIWFGLKGNEWAWNNKQWNSIEHFNSVQRAWVYWYLFTCIILGVVLGVLFGICIIASGY